jgi:nucleotide-binding universal stress UspA family protein
MLNRGPVLVPLDGSELAERALPYASALAGKLGVPLVLLTVWEGTDADLNATLPAMSLEIAKTAQAHFEKYLGEVKAKLGNTEAQIIVRPGNAGDEIMDVARETGARCIAIATHGRSGIGRWVYGSTAAKVLRSSGVPVLVVGPKVLEAKRETVEYSRIMVPLDGSAASEQALAVAKDLAEKLGASMSLVRAIQWAAQAYPYTLPDTYVPQLDDELEKAAKEYLRNHEEALGKGKVDAFVVRGPTADGLLDFIEQKHVDLVVMTTHARSGLARMALGSVADRTLQAKAPVLLVRVADDKK